MPPILRAPENLCLYENPLETAAFLKSLYSEAVVLRLDFTPTQNMTAAAALALFAHINNIQRSKGNNGCFDIYCKLSPVYTKFFIKTGLLTALKQGRNFNNNSRLFRFGCADNYLVQRREILKKFDEYEAEFIKQNPSSANELKDFFSQSRTAFNEVLINIKNHAYSYPEPSGNEHSPIGYNQYTAKAWWQMFWVTFDEQTKKPGLLNVLVYDLGVGITSSFVGHTEGGRRNNLNHQNDPAHIMDEAMKEGMSRFIGQGRGNGLPRILDMVKRFEGSGLFVYSGRGCSRIKKDGRFGTTTLPQSLPGTLIEWTLPIPHCKDDLHE